ncbi:uncharacterized protein BX664DRAFT_319081 [Halteromyces radiatus]|uniref:uncharacterized protein n=1 Tax=Halteromyces radiatus TaxID=101107 RepID=UPI0022211ED4|nr:uncharacterized protein BX664DRAFT_319081 [Halteromyces radiatus]KAI8098589.1 hypothetical protein BX664DRAFT_319081 [Halteromyces radiatus]
MGYLPATFQQNQLLPSQKVFIYVGDITELKVDAIVNPTNPNLTNGGRGTASAAILKEAGDALEQDLLKRPTLVFGDAITTPSYLLPCNYVIHTAVPHVTQGEETLRSCYRRCLEQLEGQRKESIAFPCMGTGVQGFDQERAAHIALSTVRNYIASDANDQIKQFIFCLYSITDKEIYQKIWPFYFQGPPQNYLQL